MGCGASVVTTPSTMGQRRAMVSVLVQTDGVYVPEAPIVKKTANVYRSPNSGDDDEAGAAGVDADDKTPLLAYSHGRTYKNQGNFYGHLFNHDPENVEETWVAVCETLDVPKGQKSPSTDLVVRRSGWKTVRIFVSSTFKDFQHEREVLVKQVFPDLRAWCEKRRLHLVECDLRWGIPKDSTTELTLRTCLGEIDRCYADNIMPYFLNMTSERIGWIPTPGDVPQTLVEEYRWIFGLSITEMEIIHGAYRKDNPNSLFLVRNDDFLASVPENHRHNFVDEHPLALAKLKMLRSMLEDRFPKERLVKYTCKYSGVKTETDKVMLDLDESFYNTVMDFFKQRITHQYPLEESNVDPFQQTKESHESFMKQRCDSVWGRKTILDEIEDYIDGVGNDVPQLVLGGAGSGKSSIMAKAADMTVTRALHHKIPGGGKKGWHVFYHFVGAVPGSIDLEGALKRLLVELGVVNDSSLPKDLEEASQLCCSTLSNVNTPPVVVFVDALNQFQSDATTVSMTWVPRKLAPQVRCVFSMIPKTPPHHTLTTRDPENVPKTLTVPPLTLMARKEIVADVLGRFQKKLTLDQMIELLNKDSSANPLWLSIACEELRVFGDFKQISEKVASLKDSLLDLLGDVLQRFEEENGSFLLVATLCLLEVSTSGLLESELLTILSEEENLVPPTSKEEKGSKEKSEKEGQRFKGEQLPAYKWAQVYRALRTFLRPYGDSGEGRLDFYHRSLSKAVRKKYFKLDAEGGETEDTRKLYLWWHTLLADYFQHTDNLDRKVEEYPYHLLFLRDQERMTKFLLDQAVIDKLYNEDFSSSLLFFWRKGGGGIDRLNELYKEQALNMANCSDVNKEKLTFKLQQTGHILHQAGAYEDATELAQMAYNIEEKELGNRVERMVELSSLMCFCLDGQLKRHEFLTRAMLPKEKECIDWAKKSIDLRKKLTGKVHKFKLAKMMVQLGFNLSSWALIGGNQEMTAAAALEEGQRHVKAARVIFEEFKLAKMMVQLGFNLSSWALIGGNQEMTAAAALEEGQRHVKAARVIFEEMKDRGNIAEAIMTLAVLARTGSSEQLKLYEEAMDLCQQVYGDYSVLAGRIYINTGIFYEDTGNYNKAYEYFRNNYRVHLQVFGEEHTKAQRARKILQEPMYKRIARDRGDALPEPEPEQPPE